MRQAHVEVETRMIRHGAQMIRCVAEGCLSGVPPSRPSAALPLAWSRGRGGFKTVGPSVSP